ncbi:MAG: sulfite exporter TauE/SafE family protein [Clostridia bacterium]|nr:sulfite exporter TauE/SafE family protein [Clostridia bacterium]
MNIPMLFLLVLAASILQAGTGFGFSIAAMPFLLLLLEPHTAVQLNIILSIFISLAMVYKIHTKVRGKVLTRLIGGSILGVFPGLWIFFLFDLRFLKIFVSISILISTILLITKVKIRKSRFREVVVGFLSGFFTSSMGIPGPPLLVYFSGTKADKSMLRGTALAYFAFIYPLSLLLQFFTYGISLDTLKYSLWSLPFAAMGISVGQWVFTKLNQENFEKIILFLLFFTGIYLLYSAL